MSLTLGPIHYWLYNKIKIAEDRSFALHDGLHGAGVDVAAERDRYGDRLPDADLTELVGDNSIHSFLQGLITRIQIFEASLVEAAVGHEDLIFALVEQHGRKTGQEAVAHQGGPATDVNQLGRLVNDYQLEGMPCDPSPAFAPGEGELTYRHTACNHLANWEYTGAKPETMCALTNRWLAGFVEGAGSAEFILGHTIVDGAPDCQATIRLPGSSS
jgi:hypothetical protein